MNDREFKSEAQEELAAEGGQQQARPGRTQDEGRVNASGQESGAAEEGGPNSANEAEPPIIVQGG